MFKRYKEHLYHVGAYKIHQNESQLAGFKINIRSSQIEKRYVSQRSEHVYTCGAMSSTGRFAIGVSRALNRPSGMPYF